MSIRMEVSIGLPLSTKSFLVFASIVAFLVMMKNIAMDFQAILKLSGSTVTGLELMEVLRVGLKKLERWVVMDSRFGKMIVQMLGKLRRPPTQ